MQQPATVEELLRTMVSFNTVNTAVSGDPFTELKLSEYLEELARAWGFATRRLPVEGRTHNLLVTHEADASAPWLMFDSHLDTVTVEGMTVDPLAGEVRDGRMYGRGTCDTKGTGAAMLWALRQHAQQGGGNNVAILFSVDEEYGMTGVRSFIANDCRQLGFVPRGVIVGEPTMLKPIVAHNGAVRWRVQTTGVAAHSSDPSRGVSAISKMVKVIAAIESRYIPSLTRYHQLTGKAQCSVNIIHGGNQINVVPEHCYVDVDRRVVPGEKVEDVLPAVQAVLDDLAAKDTSLKVSQTLLFSCPPLAPERDGALLKVVQGVLGSMQIPTEPLGVPYATNGGDLAVAGIPVIVLGPGDIAQAHTKDEFLALDQLARGVEVYLGLMRATL